MAFEEALLRLERQTKMDIDDRLLRLERYRITEKRMQMYNDSKKIKSEERLEKEEKIEIESPYWLHNTIIILQIIDLILAHKKIFIDLYNFIWYKKENTIVHESSHELYDYEKFKNLLNLNIKIDMLANMRLQLYGDIRTAFIIGCERMSKFEYFMPYIEITN